MEKKLEENLCKFVSVLRLEHSDLQDVGHMLGTSPLQQGLGNYLLRTK